MTTKTKVYLAAAAALVAIQINQTIKTRRTHQRIRKEIAAKLAVDLYAMHGAEEVILERMLDGAYTSWQAAMNDFDFETIIRANRM